MKFRQNRKGSNKTISKGQKNASYNIEMLYKTKNEAIKFYDDYSLMASEAENKANNEGKGLKILNPKQLL